MRLLLAGLFPLGKMMESMIALLYLRKRIRLVGNHRRSRLERNFPESSLSKVRRRKSLLAGRPPSHGRTSDG